MKPALFTLVFEHTPIDEAIRKTAELGYEGVELMCRAPHLAEDTPLSKYEELKKLADSVNLPIINLATYTGNYSKLTEEDCRKQLDKLKHYLRIAEITNCPMIRQWSGGPSIREATEEQFQNSVYWFQQAADIAREAGKKIVIEIHNGSIIETAESARKFMDMINRDNVGLIYDPGNMYITDTDFNEKAVELLFDKIFHVHIKEEMRVKDDKLPHSFHNQTKYGDEIFQYRLLSEGAVDHVPCFQQLKKMGYKGFLSSECHGMQNDYDTAKHEITVMRKLLQSL